MMTDPDVMAAIAIIPVGAESRSCGFIVEVIVLSGSSGLPLTTRT